MAVERFQPGSDSFLETWPVFEMLMVFIIAMPVVMVVVVVAVVVVVLVMGRPKHR